MTTRLFAAAFFLCVACQHRSAAKSANPPGGTSTNPNDSETVTGNSDGDSPPVTTVEFGLDARPPNPTCRAPARPPILTAGDIGLVPAFPNMKFGDSAASAVLVLARDKLGPNEPLRWFAALRHGEVWTFVDANASMTGLAADGKIPVEKAELFLKVNPDEISDLYGEGGMMGFALDPDYRNDPAHHAFAYVHYSNKIDDPNKPGSRLAYNKVVRFKITRGADGHFTASDAALIFRTPSGGETKYGGDLKFGPDKYLYISLGDGGLSDVTNAWYSERPLSVRGKILRVDPRATTTAYAIPADNPYAGQPLCNDRAMPSKTPCPEVWAMGFRNPYRMNFDRVTGDLWVGDVGTLKDEIEYVKKGGNYGWNTCDGILPAGSSDTDDITAGVCPPLAKSPDPAYIAPVAEYRKGPRVSVIAGFVYRGSMLKTFLDGAFIFADLGLGHLFVLDKPLANVQASPLKVTTTYEHPDEGDPRLASLPRFRRLQDLSVPSPIAFAEDEDGEIYVVTFSNDVGQGVYKLGRSASAPQDTIPALLSQTGCVDPKDPTKPAAGMIPYDINAPFWSDGAEKTRFLALPDGAAIQVGADGDFDLPNESVVMKHFRLGGLLRETRLFVRHQDGGWAGYTYVWRDDQSDAVAAKPDGETHVYGNQAWIFPSRTQCLNCHTSDAGGTLGLEARQLDRDFTYAGGKKANQLKTLSHIGVFAAPLDPAGVTPLLDPFGDGDLTSRARAYLHSNCAQCHRGAGQKPNFLITTAEADMRLCDAPAFIVPGHPESSELVARMQSGDPSYRMPRSAGTQIDQKGVELLSAWIAAKTTCP